MGKVITQRNEACEYFKELTRDDILNALRGNGRVYCLTCRVWVYRDDLSRHEGHRLVIGVFEEPHVHEETYSAD
ncbi:MAG TPA: hypothetical protein ENF75_00010 [Acidilobales archaeon]|nr:MAG: hypothetical protein DRO18_07165 [Thermoprotei archaeon]HDD25459.1 hypothetical protein [Acidilobales archaeon]